MYQKLQDTYQRSTQSFAVSLIKDQLWNKCSSMVLKNMQIKQLREILNTKSYLKNTVN